MDRWRSNTACSFVVLIVCTASVPPLMTQGSTSSSGTTATAELTTVWEKAFHREMRIDLSRDGRYLAYVSWAHHETPRSTNEVGLVSPSGKGVLWTASLPRGQFAPHAPCFEERNHQVVVSYYDRATTRGTATPSTGKNKQARHLGGLYIYDSMGKVRRHVEGVTGIPLYAGPRAVVVAEEAGWDDLKRIVILDGDGNHKAEIAATKESGCIRQAAVAPDGRLVFASDRDGIRAFDISGRMLWKFSGALSGSLGSGMTPANPNILAVEGEAWLTDATGIGSQPNVKVVATTIVNRQGRAVWCHGALGLSTRRFDSPFPAAAKVGQWLGSGCHIGAGYGRTTVLTWSGNRRELHILGDMLYRTEGACVRLPDAEVPSETVALSGDGRWVVIAQPAKITPQDEQSRALIVSVYSVDGELVARTRIPPASVPRPVPRDAVGLDLQMSTDGRIIAFVTLEKAVVLRNTAVDLPQYQPERPESIESLLRQGLAERDRKGE